MGGEIMNSFSHLISHPYYLDHHQNPSTFPHLLNNFPSHSVPVALILRIRMAADSGLLIIGPIPSRVRGLCPSTYRQANVYKCLCPKLCWIDV